jgi:protein required for attachment to host cells
MPKYRKLLFTIADGEHVRFVRPASGNALRSDAAMDSISAHKRSADLGSDHPGAAMHSGSTAHHALTPRHDLHLEEKEKFAHTVAAQLNDGEFDDLVIVAPARILAAIRQKFSAVTDAKVIGTLSKDLVHTPDKDLWAHVGDWVKPLHQPPPRE